MKLLKNLRNDIYTMLSVCHDNKFVVGEQYEAIVKAIKAVKKTIPQKVKRDPFGVECPS